MATELNIFDAAINDYEFLGLTFNGRHSSEFNLTVVSPSDRTIDSLFADFEDQNLEVNGRDGAYYFGTKIKTKQVTVTFAFNELTSENKRDIITWLNPKIISKLIFDEAPYKYYYVKLANAPSFSFIPFEKTEGTIKTHIFKGELAINFISMDPYSYCDYSTLDEVPIFNFQTNPYSNENIPGWFMESGLFSTNPLNLVKANDSDGFSLSTFPVVGVTHNFYNGGTVESPIEFTATISAFGSNSQADTTVWELKNTTHNESFKLYSLRKLNGLSDNAGPWTIYCNPSKKLLTSTISGVTYNLMPLHNGIFLKSYSGNNTITTNYTMSNVNFKYKYKYW